MHVPAGKKAPHVVIIGGGFAGISAVKELRKTGTRVTLIDREICATFQPLLYQVAAGGLNPGDITYPFRSFVSHNVRFRNSLVTGIDPEKKHVMVDDGDPIPYDYLVVCAGVAANFMNVPGAREFTYPLYTRRDAIELRDTILGVLEEKAEQPGSTKDIVVSVVGGGPTGVETVGTLAEMRLNVLRDAFPELQNRNIFVRLIDGGTAPLKPFDNNLRNYTQKELLKRGVDFYLGQRLVEVKKDSIVLKSGEELQSDITIWAAGVTVSDAVSGWGLPQGKGGRILIDHTCRVQGHPEIFAVGDIAGWEDEPLPQLAQPAIQMGRHAAKEIIHEIEGKPRKDFHYFDKGTMATIGLGDAILQLPPTKSGKRGRMVGFIPWLTWIAVHVDFLLGGRSRAAVLLGLSYRYARWTKASSLIVGDTLQSKSEMTSGAIDARVHGDPDVLD